MKWTATTFRRLENFCRKISTFLFVTLLNIFQENFPRYMETLGNIKVSKNDNFSNAENFSFYKKQQTDNKYI